MRFASLALFAYADVLSACLNADIVPKSLCEFEGSEGSVERCPAEPSATTFELGGTLGFVGRSPARC